MTNTPDFDARLDRLAEVAVRVGLGLRPGQELVMTAPLEALPLARRITVQAYKAGASVVTTLLSDDQATLARFENGHDDAFDKAAGWLYEGMAQAYRSGAARLAISGDDPSLLAGQDPDKVARANRARSKAYMPALEQIANFATNWTIVSAANPAWARTVFPICRRIKRSPGCGTRSLPPRGSTGRIRSAPGRRTIGHSATARPPSTPAATPPCISAGPAPI